MNVTWAVAGLTLLGITLWVFYLGNRYEKNHKDAGTPGMRVTIWDRNFNILYTGDTFPDVMVIDNGGKRSVWKAEFSLVPPEFLTPKEKGDADN